MNIQPNLVFWLVGLSGAGKTTIGKALVRELRSRGKAVVFIDGDEIRDIFKHYDVNRSYSVEERRKNAERISEISKWIHRQNVIVVCSILCIFEDVLQENRKLYGSKYKEIFLQAPVSSLVDRSHKNIYRLAFDGQMSNVVGVDIPFPIPKHPDLTIDNGDTFTSIEAAVQEILNLLK